MTRNNGAVVSSLVGDSISNAKPLLLKTLLNRYLKEVASTDSQLPSGELKSSPGTSKYQDLSYNSS